MPSASQAEPYRNATLPAAKRVKDLLSRMTLEEKAAQMMCVWQKKAETLVDADGNFDLAKAKAAFKQRRGLGQVGRPSDAGKGKDARGMAELTNAIQKFFIENSRLGIPVIFHEECLHGHAAIGGTSFPQPIALGATFNPELVEALFTMTAAEARLRGTHQALTPVVDVAREPRWGRVEETYGEDPYLVSRMGIAAVRGFQGDATFDDKRRVIATLKHFAAHGQPESGTNCAPANVSMRLLRETFLYPFHEALKQGGAISVMASYNEIDGVPSHANPWLLRDVLRKEWGFKGFVVSDYYAIYELSYRPESHGHFVAKDKKEACALAVQAGVNIELPEPDCYLHLVELVRKGVLQERQLDELVAPMLFWKFQMGLFDDPYVDPDEAERVVGCEPHRQLALQAARESITLLKNEGNLLPLDPDRHQDHRGHRPQCQSQFAGRLQRRAEARRHRAGRHSGAARQARESALQRRLQDHHRRLLDAGRGHAERSRRGPQTDRGGRQGGAPRRRDRARHRRQRADLARGLVAHAPGRPSEPRPGGPAGRSGQSDAGHRQTGGRAAVQWPPHIHQLRQPKRAGDSGVLVSRAGDRSRRGGSSVRRFQPGRQAAHLDSAVGRPSAGVTTTTSRPRAAATCSTRSRRSTPSGTG